MNYSTTSLSVYVVVFGNLDIALKVGLPVYVFLLTTMVWRSVVQAYTTPNFFNNLCAFGSFMFAVSDGFIAIDKFYVQVPHGRVTSYHPSFLLNTIVVIFFSTTSCLLTTLLSVQ